jgi:hypothetical protein
VPQPRVDGKPAPYCAHHTARPPAEPQSIADAQAAVDAELEQQTDPSNPNPNNPDPGTPTRPEDFAATESHVTTTGAGINGAGLLSVVSGVDDLLLWLSGLGPSVRLCVTGADV